MDFIEVDATSRTRIEDARNLLDNVQYVPTMGRRILQLSQQIRSS